MPILKIMTGEKELSFSFSGTPTVQQVLLQAGIRHDHPCGGRGVCGKCQVRISGSLSALTEKERIPGYRLSCVTRLLGDATVSLPDREKVNIEGVENSPRPDSNRNTIGLQPDGATGVFDIGTTTVAFRLLDRNGNPVTGNGALNPQRSVSADVIGRIAAAGENGTRMRELILDCMKDLTEKTLTGNGETLPNEWIITGNTVMLYLLTGTDPTELGRAPFTVSRRFDETVTLPFGKVYLPPCMGAFTGADLGCAILTSGMTEQQEPALLCDAGTNGEIALWDGKTLRVTSVAAGPAFEGVGIRNGRMSIPGAICRVRLVNGEYYAETVGNLPPVGLCGSGVLDVLARGLERGDIEADGTLTEPIRLSNGVLLYPEDVRAVQLAKAALAAGIIRLTEEAGIQPDRVRKWYLCGGFGSHLDPEAAVTVGLLPPAAKGKTVSFGNAALDGACRLIREEEKEKLRRITAGAEHVALGGDPAFNTEYIRQMMFPGILS